MSFLDLLALIVLQSANSLPASAASEAEVVVSGERRVAELKLCLAKKCSPEQEVEAAMNAGAELFRSGRYAESQGVLRRAIYRNKNYAGRIPGKLSDLYATYADVSMHYGDMSAVQHGTHRSVAVLREHVGRTAAVTLGARIGVANMLLATTGARAADSSYRSIALDAEATGQRRLAALVTFRRAWLALARQRYDEVPKLIDQVAALSSDPAIGTHLRALRVRLALKLRDNATADRLLAEWKTSPQETPTLIAEPPLPAMSPIDLSTGNGSYSEALRDVRWVDIGYWVRPSGSTAEVEVLRPVGAEAWSKPLLEIVAKRRYVPLADDPGNPGVYQVHRYSLRREIGLSTGSRIARRYGSLNVVEVDMTRAGKDGPTP